MLPVRSLEDESSDRSVKGEEVEALEQGREEYRVGHDDGCSMNPSDSTAFLSFRRLRQRVHPPTLCQTHPPLPLLTRCYRHQETAPATTEGIRETLPKKGTDATARGAMKTGTMEAGSKGGAMEGPVEMVWKARERRGGG
jgi:hypothetical protein